MTSQQLIPLIVAFVVGCLTASFLNVVIWRVPNGISLVDPPRSFCPRCKARIAWYDNIPVLSWLILRGRARCCGGKFSVRYPAVELLTGLCIYYAAKGVSATVLASRHHHDVATAFA